MRTYTTAAAAARVARAVLETLERRRLLSAGDLDATFSADGKQVVDLPGSASEVANAVAVDASGKVVLAGRMQVGAETDFAVARLNADGTIDTTFGGGDGFVSIDFAINDEATDVAIDGSGRVVVVGTSNAGAGSNARDFAVARLTLNGALDTTFSGDGKLEIDFGTNDDAQAVALHGGLIYVGGYKDIGTTGQFALARLTSNGLLDTTYSGDGKVNFAYGANNDSRCYDVAVDAAGRVVMIGYDENLAIAGNTRDLAVARLGTDALLDDSFSGDGLVAVEVNFDDELRAVGIDLRGRVVAGGFTEGISGGGDDFAAIRLLDNGALDTSFNGDGKFTRDFGNIDQCEDLALQPDGTVTLSGRTHGSGFQAALVQLSPFTGQPSTGFGDDGDGAQFVDFGTLDQGFAIALTGDFRTVIAGTDGSGKLAVARMRDLIDANFDTPTTGMARNLIALPDGKLIEHNLATVKRLRPDGSADPTFNTIFATDMAFADVAIDGAGRIVVGGSKDGAAAVRRYRADGTADTTFSGDGEITFHYGSDGSASAVRAIAIDASNRVVAAGSRFLGGDRDVAVARLTTGGALDGSFDGDGVNVLVINNLTLDDDINDVALQPDGRIVFVGFSDSTTVSSAAFVARLNADGSRDGSFAGNGVNTFDIGLNSDANAKAVLIDGGGRLLVGGSGSVGPADQGFVARFTSGGAFDDTFAGDGLLNLQFAPLGESVNGLALDAAGNIYTAGTIVVGVDTSRVLVRKLLPSGSGGAGGFSGDGAWVVPGTLSGSSFGPIPVLADGAVHVGAPGASARRLNVDPAVVDLELLFETAPQRLRVQFNDDVGATLADADVTVRNTTTSQTLSITTYDLVSFDAATNTAILQFNSILPDGDYTATLSGITVENRQGMRLGGDRTREFFFLMGDANRDKRVNLADFNLLAANFGQSNRTFTRADFTYDGQVNLADFNVLASRFGSSLGAASRANGERGYDGTGVPGDDYPDDLLA